MSQSEAFSQHMKLSGVFSEETLAKLRSDIKSLEKVATGQTKMDFVRNAIPAVAAILATSAIGAGFDYYHARKKYDNEQLAMHRCYEAIKDHEEFKKNQAGFNQRFHELSLISPVVASAPQLARKVIAGRLDTGFNLEDAHRLAAIEHNTLLTPRTQDPLGVVKAQTLVAAGNVLNYILPSLAVRQNLPHEEAAKAPPGFDKKGSPMNPISDECLGKMLADSHLMCKEAGMMGMAGAAGKFLKPSAKNIVTYLEAMTIPLALGVGYKAMQGYMDSRKKKDMVSNAEKVYAGLKRTSDVIAGNQEIADQAFDALRTFAPALAAKPIIAKTFIENVVNGQGHLDPNTANMLATTQASIQGLEKQPGGFLAGLKEPMSIFSLPVPGTKMGKKPV
jgi:hypothetical protein